MCKLFNHERSFRIGESNSHCTGVNQHTQLNACIRANGLAIFIKTKSILTNLDVWISQNYVQNLDAGGHRVSNDRIDLSKEIVINKHTVCCGG